MTTATKIPMKLSDRTINLLKNFASINQSILFKQGKSLRKYKEMVELERPSGTDTNTYKDFDAYMTKLDPVGGYLAGKFGKEKAESLVNNFLFCYG